eukprot:NODE_573_length_1954_cov_33.025722_g460_i0.p1 GENE.NODE_573_length_1954_cov_33.025722_g460_i0~~NODE_573_length_1954_cov_33.025722_g460_i0.p1  ORF type:complete len:637 (-),score=155.52 NODE_573_length_1954_cov_33.025722_g460_i0:42-1787(-)
MRNLASTVDKLTVEKEAALIMLKELQEEMERVRKERAEQDGQKDRTAAATDLEREVKERELFSRNEELAAASMIAEHRIHQLEIELDRCQDELHLSSEIVDENRRLREQVLNQEESLVTLRNKAADLESGEASRGEALALQLRLEDEFSRKLKEAEKAVRKEVFEALSDEAKVALHGAHQLQNMLHTQNDTIELMLTRCKTLDDDHAKLKADMALADQSTNLHLAEIRRLKKRLDESKAQNSELLVKVEGAVNRGKGVQILEDENKHLQHELEETRTILTQVAQTAQTLRLQGALTSQLPALEQDPLSITLPLSSPTKPLTAVATRRAPTAPYSKSFSGSGKYKPFGPLSSGLGFSPASSLGGSMKARNRAAHARQLASDLGLELDAPAADSHPTTASAFSLTGPLQPIGGALSGDFDSVSPPQTAAGPLIPLQSTMSEPVQRDMDLIWKAIHSSAQDLMPPASPVGRKLLKSSVRSPKQIGPRALSPAYPPKPATSPLPLPPKTMTPMDYERLQKDRGLSVLSHNPSGPSPHLAYHLPRGATAKNEPRKGIAPRQLSESVQTILSKSMNASGGKSRVLVP